MGDKPKRIDPAEFWKKQPSGANFAMAIAQRFGALQPSEEEIAQQVATFVQQFEIDPSMPQGAAVCQKISNVLLEELDEQARKAFKEALHRDLEAEKEAKRDR